MHRASLALLAVALLALPAAADAAQFKVSVKGKQIDTWSGAQQSFNGGCTYTNTASGRSIFKFTTTKPAKLDYPGSEIGRTLRLSVRASGDLQHVETLGDGQDPAACPPPGGVSEDCPAKTKRSSFKAVFLAEDDIFSVGRGEQANLLKACPTLGRLSGFGGSAGLLRKKIKESRIRGASEIEISGTMKDSRQIHGIGKLTSKFQMTATLTRLD